MIQESLNNFINNFESNCKKWKKVTIFLDNSGYDLILGIFPFVRELLKYEIQVYFYNLLFLIGFINFKFLFCFK